MVLSSVLWLRWSVSPVVANIQVRLQFVALFFLSQREHYKLDWHRFNLKQRLRNKPVLSALDFEKWSSTGDD